MYYKDDKLLMLNLLFNFSTSALINLCNHLNQFIIFFKKIHSLSLSNETIHYDAVFNLFSSITWRGEGTLLW